MEDRVSVKILSQLPDPWAVIRIPNVPLSATVADVKQRIHLLVDSKPPVSHQRLIYRGRVMARDSDTLREIFADATDLEHTIHLVVREQGTAPQPPIVEQRPGPVHTVRITHGPVFHAEHAVVAGHPPDMNQLLAGARQNMDESMAILRNLRSQLHHGHPPQMDPRGHPPHLPYEWTGAEQAIADLRRLQESLDRAVQNHGENSQLVVQSLTRERNMRQHGINAVLGGTHNSWPGPTVEEVATLQGLNERFAATIRDFDSQQFNAYLINSPSGPQAVVHSPLSVYQSRRIAHMTRTQSDRSHNEPNGVVPNARPIIPERRAVAIDLTPFVQALWLFVRVYGIMWLFLGGAGTEWFSWRMITLVVVSILYWIVQAGYGREWIEIGRIYWDSIIGLPRAPAPPLEQPQANAIREYLRPLERTIALFVASLYPGVGERHVAERERIQREERETREREEQERQQRQADEDAKRLAEESKPSGTTNDTSTAE